MSKFSQRLNEIVFGVFTALAIDFTKPIDWARNWLPVAARERFARYQLLDAMVNNYLDALLTFKGHSRIQYDKQGRLKEAYSGYGEARKVAGLISNAITGDGLKIASANETVNELWEDMSLGLKLPDGEDRGSELGDIVYHVALDSEEQPQLEFVDPEGFFIFEKEFDKLIHAAWAYFPADGTKREKELLTILEYKLAGKVNDEGKRLDGWRVYWRKARWEIRETNKSDTMIEGVSLEDNMTTNQLTPAQSVERVGDISLSGWATLGKGTVPIDELPFVHIPFLSVAGETWGQSAIHYVFNAIVDVYATNADLRESAKIAAIPVFWKKRDQYNTEGVKGIDPETNEEFDPCVEPGDMYDGEVGLVDNSNSLKAAIDYRHELMKITHENNNIPSVIYDVQNTKIISGIALDIALYPFRTFVNKVRAKREKQYFALIRVILKRTGQWNENALDKTKIIFGVFANLGQQLLESISKIVLAGVLTSNEGRAILVDSGIIDADLIDESFDEGNTNGGNTGREDRAGSGGSENQGGRRGSQEDGGGRGSEESGGVAER